MADNRRFPDITFVETDTEGIKTGLVQGYEAITGRKLYPADPMRFFILWVADIIIQERALINWSARQNVPRFAEGEYLDSLAELFKDVERLRPQPAKTTFRFWLSMKQEGAHTIPAGTRVTVDGEITFATLEPLFIEAGKLYGDAAAECITLTESGESIGAAGNGFLPGQITQIVDVYPFFERVENLTESAGGADWESDAAFYERMRESMETFSTAGPMGAYEYYAKTASSLVSDAKATGPEEEPGVVDVRVLLQGGALPTEEVIKTVLETLSAERVRPLADFVRVSAPDEVPFDIDFTYYIPTPSAASVANIERAVSAAVEQYKAWQTEKMGRDINPSYLTRLLMETGVKRVEIRKPKFQKVEPQSVAVLKETVILSGGVEDE